VPSGLSWICVSPKAGTELVVRSGDELKLVYPQPGAEPERYETLRFDHFFLQPMDGPERERNTALCVKYCLEHPKWRLSLQTHKYIGLR
jgi:7-carboxy-7-deazaguanine synthase